MSIGNGSKERKAWVVLLTRSNYLAATILLHYSLQRVKSKYPLYVLVTPTLPQPAVQALKDAGCEIINVEVLRPQIEVSVVAERFADTWDKLRAFGLDGFDVSQSSSHTPACLPVLTRSVAERRITLL